METYKGFIVIEASSAVQWRQWLEKNHATEKSVWLVIYKKGSGIPSVHYPEALEEALCFGWIDSKPNKRDEKSYYLFFSRRNVKSKWSKVNRNKVEMLISQGRMTDAGLKMVELSRESGTWQALDMVESLVVPKELEQAFSDHPGAKENWEAFPRSVKRGHLELLENAKRKDTKTKRAVQIAEAAQRNVRFGFRQI